MCQEFVIPQPMFHKPMIEVQILSIKLTVFFFFFAFATFGKHTTVLLKPWLLEI